VNLGMAKAELTREGHQRLHTRLINEREQLLETEEFIRQQLLCKCDVDQLSLREAKEKKMQLQQRVEELEEVLSRATVLKGRNDKTAGLGAFVTLLHEETREPMVVQLVSKHEATVTEDAVPHISDASPVGQKLLGRRIGDRIQVRVRNRVDTHYQVTAIRY
jgi:transcription elongation factor GreA